MMDAFGVYPRLVDLSTCCDAPAAEARVAGACSSGPLQVCRRCEVPQVEGSGTERFRKWQVPQLKGSWGYPGGSILGSSWRGTLGYPGGVSWG